MCTKVEQYHQNRIGGGKKKAKALRSAGQSKGHYQGQDKAIKAKLPISCPISPGVLLPHHMRFPSLVLVGVGEDPPRYYLFGFSFASSLFLLSLSFQRKKGAHLLVWD